MLMKKLNKMETVENKIETHNKLLQQENLKNKNKRVNFSIFKANTFEEMEELRKTREIEFKNMLITKERINETFKNVSCI
jgi:hypothetical protein